MKSKKACPKGRKGASKSDKKPSKLKTTKEPIRSSKKSPYQHVRYTRYIVRVAKKTTAKYKKGQRVSEAYAKRYPKLTVKQQWMKLENRKLVWDAVTRKQQYGDWQTVAKDRLTMQEIILRPQSFDNRSVYETFAKKRIYQKLWINEKGNIRVTINGSREGQRIKEVVHLGFLKHEWSKLHNGYAQFKEWLVGSILSNLKRRGLRLSNPKESRERLVRLKQKLRRETSMLPHVPEYAHHNQVAKIEAIARSIRKQELSRQLHQPTIRIEKLV